MLIPCTFYTKNTDLNRKTCCSSLRDRLEKTAVKSRNLYSIQTFHDMSTGQFERARTEPADEKRTAAKCDPYALEIDFTRRTFNRQWIQEKTKLGIRELIHRGRKMSPKENISMDGRCAALTTGHAADKGDNTGKLLESTN